jgi:hypothetical protein
MHILKSIVDRAIEIEKLSYVGKRLAQGLSNIQEGNCARQSV